MVAYKWPGKTNNRYYKNIFKVINSILLGRKNINAVGGSKDIFLYYKGEMIEMSKVKWIKITTNVFDVEKIQLIESMPDSDSIIVI